VRGNHDNALGFGVDCQCMGTFREYSLATRDWHRTLLGETDLQFLRQMPTLDRFEWDSRRFHIAHATPEGNLFEYLSMDQWGERVADIDADFVLLGHTHVPGMSTFGKVTVVNPGSVGLARDRGGEACYAVFENGRMQLKRCRYDAERTVAALRAAPLPPGIADGLARVLLLA
jgi:predicted phosphodiesterase